MKASIWKDFSFEAAHRLPNVPEDHPCSRMHGHSYRFRLEAAGDLDPTLGWVMDFAFLGSLADQLIIRELDHRTLNDVKGLENPTAEVLALWILERVKLAGIGELVTAVEVYETPKCGVRVEA